MLASLPTIPLSSNLISYWLSDWHVTLFRSNDAFTVRRLAGTHKCGNLVLFTVLSPLTVTVSWTVRADGLMRVHTHT